MKMCRWTAPVLIAVAALCFGALAQAADLVKLQGAGASFPAPLYLKWFKGYSGAHRNVQIDYQSVGSGSGVKSFIDRTVDFGASDAVKGAAIRDRFRWCVREGQGYAPQMGYVPLPEGVAAKAAAALDRLTIAERP